MNRFSKYAWIGYTSARSNFAYAGEVAARTLFMAVVLYIFLHLWKAVYAGSGADRLGGLTLAEMLWYLTVTEAVWMSSVRLWREVDEDVRTGRLAVQLLKPLSYPCAVMAKALGERFVRFALNMAVGSVVTFALVGPIRLTGSGLLLFAIVVPMAFVLDALGFMAIGLFAFWFESTAGLALIYGSTVMLTGGMMLPLELYPDAVQEVLRWLPFSGMVYGPARMLVAADGGQASRILLTQAIGLVAMVFIVAAIQRFAIKRIQTNGG